MRDDTSATPAAGYGDHYARQATRQPDAMDAFWMPFSANRQFKAEPRLLASASGMFYRSVDGREILDGTGGLWCCNAGHARPRIVDAVQQQIATLDFAPTFQMGHPLPFTLAERLVEIAPDHLNHVFFTNSGSESVDTALKIALAYHRARGEGHRTRLIGREKGYHGVGFGGISVGGLPNNRKFFGSLLPGVDHLRHTLDLQRNAFSRGLPQHGAELADDLERMVLLHDASTIAAVIVEPVAGSAGVVLPRAICDKHGILLIFDEVITGFGRVGKAFAAQRFEVMPDMITTAKGLTNGCVPMGAVFVSDGIHDAFMHGPGNMIELFHGYTYSGHPLACAAALAVLGVMERDNLIGNVRVQGAYLGRRLGERFGNHHHVGDIRGRGHFWGIELVADRGGKTPFAAGRKLHGRVKAEAMERGLMVYPMGGTVDGAEGDHVLIAPPFTADAALMDTIVDRLGDAVDAAIRSSH
jgi:beta-alanine--pyruvate transaminase